MWGRLVKIALSLPFLVAAGLFGAYLVFGFFLDNPLAQKLLPWIGEEKLASRLGAERDEFNPLTLEATVTGLRLTEKSGAPLAGFDRLYVNLDTTGVFGASASCSSSVRARRWKSGPAARSTGGR